MNDERREILIDAMDAINDHPEPWNQVRHKVDVEIVEILESYGESDSWFIMQRLLLASEIMGSSSFSLDISKV